MFTITGIKKLFGKKLFIWKIGLLTGLVIVLFEMINLFVMYKQIRMDYYLSLIAIFFLTVGFWINKKTVAQKGVSGEHLLTAKEIQILKLIASGKTNKEIAADHFVELSTVKTHVNNIYSKLSLKNRREACAKYAEMSKNATDL